MEPRGSLARNRRYIGRFIRDKVRRGVAIVSRSAENSRAAIYAGRVRACNLGARRKDISATLVSADNVESARRAQDRPVIVGWSSAPRGQVIKESSWATPEETGSRPARAGKDRIITHPIADETGWTTARSLGEVRAISVHSKPVCFCSDCTILDQIHRAALEKKLVAQSRWGYFFPGFARQVDLRFRNVLARGVGRREQELGLFRCCGCSEQFDFSVGDDTAVLTRCGAACHAGEPRALAAALRRVAARPHTAATGQLEAMANLMRRTLTRTRAPILSSLRRIVPQLTLQNAV